MAAQEDQGRMIGESDDYLGETPLWSPAEQALYWINCENEPQLRRWDSASGTVRSWPMPERIGGLALRERGDAVVCLASGIYDFNLATGALTLRAASPWAVPDVALHESYVDRRGRLWVGAFDHGYTPSNPFPGGGAYCRLDGDRLVPMIPHISIANSLAFSPDGRVMYAADTLRRLIWHIDMDPDRGTILGMREFIRTDEGIIADGAAVDAEGGYWLAMFGGGCVRRYTPDGKLDRVVETPFSQPTALCFGGSDLRTLFVTSTRTELPGFTAKGPNGAVWSVDAGVSGLAGEYFRG